MSSKYSFIVGFITGIFIIIIIYLISLIIGTKHLIYPVEVIDTTYNTIVLDSIEYNITIKDSVITHIRHEYEDSIIKVINFNDSTTVDLFKKLVSEP